MLKYEYMCCICGRYTIYNIGIGIPIIININDGITHVIIDV